MRVNLYKQKVHTPINFFLVVVVSISALLIYVSRIGLDNDPWIIFKSVSLSYIIILFPNIFNYFYFLKYKKFFNIPLISLFIIFIISISGLIENLIGLKFHFLYFSIGFLLLFIIVYQA